MSIQFHLIAGAGCLAVLTVAPGTVDNVGGIRVTLLDRAIQHQTWGSFVCFANSRGARVGRRNNWRGTGLSSRESPLEQLREECSGWHGKWLSRFGEAVGIDIVRIDDHLESQRRAGLLLEVSQ